MYSLVIRFGNGGNHFKKGSNIVLNSDDMNSRLAKYNDSLVISSHLFRKAVVPGISKDLNHEIKVDFILLF